MIKLTLTCFIDPQLSKLIDSGLYVFTLSNNSEIELSLLSNDEEIEEKIDSIFDYIYTQYHDQKVELLIHQDSLMKIEILNAFYYFYRNQQFSYEYDIFYKFLILNNHNFSMIMPDFNYYAFLKQNTNVDRISNGIFFDFLFIFKSLILIFICYWIYLNLLKFLPFF
jgi:gamma-glutamylcyclotransferase (GGCT)/AIG2-like uncharacterized protein YtfP